MATVDYRKLAEGILEKVGGEANISTMTHCATRLRLKLKDESLADKDAVEKLPGVITVMPAGGQFQVVIGNDVPLVYAELGKITKLAQPDAEAVDEGPKGNLFNQFIQLISSLFTPILWPLAGLGLMKALIILIVTFGWLSEESTTHTILNAASDALFYFLPLFLAVTSSKRFKTNLFTSMAIAGALVYPTIIALTDATEQVTFLGLPVIVMSYTSSVIPIIIAVWLQGYVERFFNKILPHWLRNFGTPLLVVAIMVPLVLMTVGPVTTYAAQGISAGVGFLLSTVPLLGGAVMGGLWQVFVLFGLHWGFVPIMINDLGTQGFTYLSAPLMAAVLAQAGATLAVALRTKSVKRREVASPAALSGFVAGITEPAIYGVNLPLKLPFYFGIAGGAVGGAIISLGGLAANAFVFPSLLAYPAYLEHGNFTFMIIGTVVAMVIGFTLTFFFGPREQPDEDEALEVAPAADSQIDSGIAPATSATVEIAAPVAGTTIALCDVNDKVFASGAMGPGYGIVPSEGTFVAPVTGKIVVAMKTGHAFGIKTDDGVEVLVHIGIDTVQLEGKYFDSKVTKGQRVSQGDVLAQVDLAAVEAAGFDTTTIVVVTNAAKLTEVVPADPGLAAAGAPTMTITV